MPGPPPTQSRRACRSTDRNRDLTSQQPTAWLGGAAQQWRPRVTRLPAGWTLEPSRDGDYSVLTEPDCRMSVTIDHVKRHLYPGHGNRHHGRIGMAVYTGRGWRDRMIVDAIAHLRTLLAPARTARAAGGTPQPPPARAAPPAGWPVEPLPPDHDVVRAANGDVVTLDYHERCLRIGVDR